MMISGMPTLVKNGELSVGAVIVLGSPMVKVQPTMLVPAAPPALARTWVVEELVIVNLTPFRLLRPVPVQLLTRNWSPTAQLLLGDENGVAVQPLLPQNVMFPPEIVATILVASTKPLLIDALANVGNVPVLPLDGKA